MRLTSLRIDNFRSYASTRLALQDRTYIVGSNNAGKSTAIDAIEWVLTGRCRGLDGSSREIAELVREGNPDEHKGLGVQLEIDGFGRVSRQSDGREIFLKVKDWSGSNKQQQFEMLEKLRATEAVIAACLNSDVFLRLHHAEAKNLVMGVLDVRIPADVLEPLNIAGPLSLDELERHYKRVFDRRTDAKRDLETCVVYPAPELLDGEIPPPVEELEGVLDNVRDEERDLVETTAEARGRHGEIVKQKAEADQERRTLQARIASYGDVHDALDALEARLSRMPEPVEPRAPGEPVQSADEDEAEKAEAAEVQELRTKLVDDRGRLRTIEASVDGIDRHDPAKGCILDASIPCKTPAKEFSGRLKAIRADIKGLDKAIAEHQGRLEFLETTQRTRTSNRQAEARERRQAHDAAMRTYREAVTARAQLQREISAARAKVDHREADQTRLTEVLALLARLESDLANVGEVVEPEGLATVRARIDRGEKLIAQVRVWHQEQQRHVASAAEREKKQKSVDVLEHLVERLGPKGLIVDVLEAARRTFEEKVNAALGQWGYRIEFTIDPWTVRVNGRKSTQLSVSERLRVGVALQLAIAEITGVWFVAIDAVDTLDAANRDILATVIEGWKGQIILAATKDPDFEIPDELPAGVAFYKLELREGLTHVFA